MDETMSTQALARYFAGRIERAQVALKGIHLCRYADEVMVMAPTTAGEFERFVHWCEGMASCLDRWTSLAEVRATTPEAALKDAQAALGALAKDARHLWSVYEARRARGL